MAIPRRDLVDDSRSGLYHVHSRCVRRAWLLHDGDGRRRDWIVERLLMLTACYGMDVVSLAVMSNHFHLLVRILPEVVAGWSDMEVAYRWIMVHPNRRRRRKLDIDFDALPQPVEVARLLMNPREILRRREQLASLSTFMKDLKQQIAARANEEDDTDGHFFAARFRSHRILEEAAALLCATYIDVNPVRAGMTGSAMLATHTSVQEHARRLWRDVAEAPDDEAYVDPRKDLDAFMATFDEAEFTPAMPARRERLTTVEFERDVAAMGMGGDGGDGEVVAAAVGGGAIGDTVMAMELAATPAGLEASMSLSSSSRSTSRSSSSSRRRSRSSPVSVRRPVHTRKDAASAPRRTTSAVPIMGLTLGGYLRRLRDISDQFVRAGGVTALVQRHRARGGRPPSVEELLDNPSRIDELMASATHRLSMLGTSVGSTAARVAEAVRRRLVGRDRVALAFELADDERGDPPGGVGS